MIVREAIEKSTQAFIENAENRLYKKILDLKFEGFITNERLTLDEAMARGKEAFNKGKKWGKRWEYAWLFTKVTVPSGFEGKRIVFKASVGECLVFVNKRVVGALDKQHYEITLTRNAKAGMCFEIALEVYAGHGEDIVARYSLPDEAYRQTTENIPQKYFDGGSFGVFNDEIFSILMDVKTLIDLHSGLKSESLRKLMIEKGLRKFNNTVELGVDDDEFLKCASEARIHIISLLEAENGTTTPIFSCIGHAHLDLEWLWTIDETRRKVARTIGNQLSLIEEYDDYIYLQSQPWIFETIKNEYPELYERVKKAIDADRIIPEGGMWVEADTNIPCGESLIRQVLEGKAFIKKEFDKECHILWLPDIFGCSATIPQIMKGCGIDYFYNAKMPWAYDNQVPFPRGTFNWKGIDGTEVVASINKGYVASMKPNASIDDWDKLSNKEQVPDAIYPFGYGDGGGGATRLHMEYAKRGKNLEGAPKLQIKSPVKFFENAIEKYDISHTYEGELWYSEHKGSYTSQAKIKKLNRRCEFALREAEMWLALLLYDNPDKQAIIKEELHQCWKKVLFNQFHDIIPGTSIKEVCERAESSYEQVLEKCSSIINEICGTESSDDDSFITVFNSLPWERTELIEIPKGYTGLMDRNGTKAKSCRADGKNLAEITVPSCGVSYFKLTKDDLMCEEKIICENFVLENDFIKAEFNQEGELCRLFDKEKQLECISCPSNIFRIYRDHTTMFDAWDINYSYPECEIIPEAITEIEAVSSNDVISVVKIKKKFLSSVIEQTISLKHDSRVLKFETEIDWQETHKLLKVDFSTNIHTNELISEIQFGHIKRPTHHNFKTDAAQFEKIQHKWSALCESGRGFAIFNDCKYGISAKNGIMSLTLLKAAMAPMVDSDKGRHNFTYALYPFAEAFDNSDVIKEAYNLNVQCPIITGKCEYNSYLKGSHENVVIETVKPAEDGSSDIIIRLYEAKNVFTKYKLNMNFLIYEAYITDMIENNKRKLECFDNSIKIDINAFEVITLRIKLK